MRLRIARIPDVVRHEQQSEASPQIQGHALAIRISHDAGISDGEVLGGHGCTQVRKPIAQCVSHFAAIFFLCLGCVFTNGAKRQRGESYDQDRQPSRETGSQAESRPL
jgi:hypothetical protein